MTEKDTAQPQGRGYMIGLVIVTHGGLAVEFRSALEHVVGRQTQLETIAIGPEDDMEQRRLEILKAVRDVDSGQGVIILTDMFGGTPSNLAISVMDEAKAEVIAGINLPILVKLASIRIDVPLAEATAMARDAGRKYIKVASQELSGG
jgi:PTS system mannose-specific IIA component